MRVVLAVVFAVIGAAISIYWLGNIAAEWYMNTQPQQSPDDGAAAHALAYLVTTFLCLAGGWLIGWVLGGIGRRES